MSFYRLGFIMTASCKEPMFIGESLSISVSSRKTTAIAAWVQILGTQHRHDLSHFINIVSDINK